MKNLIIIFILLSLSLKASEEFVNPNINGLIDPQRIDLLRENSGHPINSPYNNPLDQIPDLNPNNDKNTSQTSIQDQIPEVMANHSQNSSEKSSIHNFLASKTGNGNGFGENFTFEDDYKKKINIKKSSSKLLKEILNEFDAMSCQDQENVSLAHKYLYNKKEIKEPDFCSAELRNHIFTNLGNVDYSPPMLFNWMKAHLYKPLGYKMFPRYSFTDVMNAFMDMAKKESMIHPEMQIPNPRDFQRMVNKIFEQIEDSSSDFENNKGQISNLILDLLKRFHIYWNVQRQRNQMQNVHQNTFNILKKIMDKYQQTSDSMKAITIHILENIKSAYQRFQKAASMKKLIKSQSAEMIAVQILRRYKSNIEKIHMSKSSYDSPNTKLDYDSRTTEMAYLLDLLKGFFFVNYHNGVENLKNQDLYKKYIYDKIVSIYKEYNNFISQKIDKDYYDFKDWTATLLLKFEHRTFISFVVYGMDAMMNLASFEKNSQQSVIKVYYEWRDRMMAVPVKCMNSLDISLEKCMIGEFGVIYNNFYNKYQLFASVSGSNLLQFISTQNKKIEALLKSKGAYDNYPNFKNLYFSNLFKCNRAFLAQYRIHDLTSVNDLEKTLADYFENKLQSSNLSPKNFSVVDKLNKKLYQNLITIKADYNNFYPINKNPKIIKEIETTVVKEINHYKTTEINKITKIAEDIFTHVIDLVTIWSDDLIKLNNNPMNAETPGSMLLPLPPKGSDIVMNVVDEPSVISMKTKPTFIPA